MSKKNNEFGWETWSRGWSGSSEKKIPHILREFAEWDNTGWYPVKRVTFTPEVVTDILFKMANEWDSIGDKNEKELSKQKEQVCNLQKENRYLRDRVTLIEEVLGKQIDEWRKSNE